MIGSVRSNIDGSGHIRSRLRAWLAHRRFPVVVSLIAIVLAAPSLLAGWVMDDHIHRSAMVESRFSGLLPGPFDLFNFLDGDAERTAKMMDLGLVPWWTLPNLQVAFWRPVTCLTHWVDHQIWGDRAWAAHAQNLLWFGGLIYAVACLYPRLLGRTWVAGLAALLFALDDAHGMPAGFVANRNALVAMLFGTLTIIVHDRWRRDGWRIGALLAPLLLVLSLLSAEAGVATGAYLIAHALFLDKGKWGGRLAVLLVYASCFLAWRASWAWLGYGVWGSDLYIDPVNDVVRFAVVTLQRAPLLLIGQWALPPSDVYAIVENEGMRRLWTGAVIFVVILGSVLAPLLRRDAVARFWLLGMLLSLVPICAAGPSDRLLFFVGLGAMGLLAQFLKGLFDRDSWLITTSWRRCVAWFLGVFFVVVHLVVAPVGLALRSAYPLGPREFTDQFYIRTPLDCSVEEQDVIVVNAPLVFHGIFLPILRELNGQPVPRRLRILAPAIPFVEVSRPDAQTLLIRPRDGYLVEVLDRLFRGDAFPMSLGQRVRLSGMSVEVTALTENNRPAEAAFRFPVPLEDRSLRWLQWNGAHFVPYIPPDIGETEILYGDWPKLDWAKTNWVNG